MAGFLTHLVQRTLAASPITPRLAGRYEGLRAAGPVPAVHGGDETVAMPFTPATTMLRTATPAFPLKTAAPGIAHVGSAQRLHAFDATTPSMPTVEEAGAPLTPQPTDTTPVPRIEVEVEASSVPPARTPGTATPTRDSDASALARRRPSADAAEVPGEHGAAPPLIESRLHAEQARATLPAARHGGVDFAADEADSPGQPSSVRRGAAAPVPANRIGARATEGGDAGSSVVPRPAPLPATRGDPPQQGLLVEPPAHRPVASRATAGAASWVVADQAAPAPTVQVTIGRIEVRAAAPAAAPTSARPAANRPALGLADYLARRAAGGAR